MKKSKDKSDSEEEKIGSGTQDQSQKPSIQKEKNLKAKEEADIEEKKIEFTEPPIINSMPTNLAIKLKSKKQPLHHLEPQPESEQKVSKEMAEIPDSLERGSEEDFSKLAHIAAPQATMIRTLFAAYILIFGAKKSHLEIVEND